MQIIFQKETQQGHKEGQETLLCIRRTRVDSINTVSPNKEPNMWRIEASKEDAKVDPFYQKTLSLKR